MLRYVTMAWKTAREPKTEFVTIRFTETEADEMDRAASKANMTRSAFMRDCVRRVLAADKKRAKRLKSGTPGSADGGA